MNKVTRGRVWPWFRREIGTGGVVTAAIAWGPFLPGDVFESLSLFGRMQSPFAGDPTVGSGEVDYMEVAACLGSSPVGSFAEMIALARSPLNGGQSNSLYIPVSALLRGVVLPFAYSVGDLDAFRFLSVGFQFSASGAWDAAMFGPLMLSGVPSVRSRANE